jgi:hypothetical protein
VCRRMGRVWGKRLQIVVGFRYEVFSKNAFDRIY